MTKLMAVGLALGLVACGLIACGGTDNSSIVVGETSVVLELRETLTRNQEAPIGNLVADAFLAAGGPDVDVALVNGGDLRCPSEFDAAQCRDYSIAAGNITRGDLDIVLPFDNDLVTVEITGEVLKSTLERGVSGIPSEVKGYFLHVAGMTYAADCSKAAQQLDGEAKTIVSEGERVTSIKVGGVDVDPKATYKVIVAAFIAAGNDGHLRIAESTATPANVTEHDVVESYLKANSPVAPKVEGRITLTPDCIASP